MSDPPAPAPASAAGRVRRSLSMGVWLAGFAIVAVLVWPATLGGATSYTIVSGLSMEPTYHTGDLAVVRRVDSIEVGDVIVYAVPAGEPGEGKKVIHRVIGGNATEGYRTQGDNRDTPDLWRPKPGDVLGDVRFIVPQAGTYLLKLLGPIGIGLVTAALFAWAMWPRAEDEDDPGDDEVQVDGEPAANVPDGAAAAPLDRPTAVASV